MRRFALACAFAVSAIPAAANDLDALWETIHQRLGGTFQGQTYAPDSKGGRSKRWTCQTCTKEQQIRVGLYDYAYNYDTTDTAKVMRMVTGGCGFEGCKTAQYAKQGLRGLVQTGTKRGKHAKRSVLFIADRMLLVEVRSADSPTQTATLQHAVETAILNEFATAF